MNPNDIARLNRIMSLLSTIRTTPLISIPNSSDHIFELMCYFNKINDFVISGKQAICNSPSNCFRPHFNHGFPRSADYYILRDTINGKAFDLILNGTFSGASGIDHSPDICLTKHSSNKVMSFFECKNHSGTIGPGVLREMIGYCRELKTPSKNVYSEFVDVLSPALLTSAICDRAHAALMKEKYNVTIIDGL